MKPVGDSHHPAGWQALTEVWALAARDLRPKRVAGPGAFFLDSWAADGKLHLHEGLLGYNALSGFHEATAFPPRRAWFCLPWISTDLQPLHGLSHLRRHAGRGPDREQLRESGIPSLDGRAFLRLRWATESGHERIHYELEGSGGVHRILEGDAYLPPDGQRWLPAIAWVDSRRVIVQRFVASDPDNAAQGRFSLLLVDRNTRASRILAPSVPVAAAAQPEVSPTGDRVLFRAQGPGGRSELWIAATNGSGCRRILIGDADYTSWSWAPDGRALVVSHQGDLWRIRL